MRVFQYSCEILLPVARDVVFPFFADAANLQAITPAWLDFRIVPPVPETIREGVLIDYRLRVRGFPLKWRTRINSWEPPFRFVDEQLRGPYRLWVHEHTFEETADGTLCRDHVRYAVPGGALVNALFVRREVKTIFAFRQKRLAELFPATGKQAVAGMPA